MSLNIRVIAPDKIVWNAKAEEVILPTSTGQLGILSGHAALLTALDSGVMRVRIKNNWNSIVLFGGFAEVENDEIIILVNGAEEASAINLEKANKDLMESSSLLNAAKTNKEKIEATQKLRKAKARVQAASTLANQNQSIY
uniref:ATP synthase CF1 epsilon subunit n=1 Tax=Galdieria phlegrea TaxID=1389228 RepID=UPI0023D87E7E|nr:ATP synthase CF1 epsilon subunit [Galdieria phlegrea]UNJ16185.1 ATP synthase CF1 epsilon subunit [Galdieria sp.]WDA99573.1 ATP synthase CF1 epsilon subunit [Galdieria sulphuraria]WDA99763.1 ATP synthase CF1 epsilon subunit [Galdieria phlegrea]